MPGHGGSPRRVPAAGACGHGRREDVRPVRHGHRRGRSVHRAAERVELLGEAMHPGRGKGMADHSRLVRSAHRRSAGRVPVDLLRLPLGNVHAPRPAPDPRGRARPHEVDVADRPPDRGRLRRRLRHMDELVGVDGRPARRFRGHDLAGEARSRSPCRLGRRPCPDRRHSLGCLDRPHAVVELRRVCPATRHACGRGPEPAGVRP
jgi:hypothetical protein